MGGQGFSRGECPAFVFVSWDHHTLTLIQQLRRSCSVKNLTHRIKMLLHISGMVPRKRRSQGIFISIFRVCFWQWHALLYEDLELNSTWKGCEAYSIDMPNLTENYNYSMTLVRSKGMCIFVSMYRMRLSQLDALLFTS